MIRLLFSLNLLLSLLLTGCQERFDETAPCNSPEQTHPKASLYQALLDDYVQKGMPGIILRIEDEDGTWAGSSGKADIGRNISMQPCHISKAASLTKTYMAALSFLLAEEGKLNIDAPVRDFLPSEVIDKVENAGDVTIRQLINHQTGIYDIINGTAFYLSVLNNPPQQYTAEELISFAYDEPAVFSPGEKAGYSNTNTLLLSMVIEEATGEKHADLLREKILKPHGLTETYYYWHDDLPASRTAQGYFDLYNNGDIMNLSDYDVGTGSGYNGIYASASDLQRFLILLLQDETIVSHESLQQMKTFYSDTENGRDIGAGIFRDFIHLPEEKQGIGHRGRDLAYSADVYYFPFNESSFSLMANYGTDAASSLQPVYMELRDKVADELTNSN